MVFAFILLALLAISMLYNLQQFFGSLLQGGRRYAQAAGPKLEEVVREDNGARDKVALIELTGIITSDAYDGGGYGMVDVIQAQLDRAAEDDQVRAVLLKVDSQGGEVLAAEEAKGGAVKVTIRITVEIEGSDKPGCVVDTISLLTFE